MNLVMLTARRRAEGAIARTIRFPRRLREPIGPRAGRAAHADAAPRRRRRRVSSAPVLLDSDTLSDLSRGHPIVTARATEYLERHGRLTVSAVSIFERLRGYRAALRLGKPLH